MAIFVIYVIFNPASFDNLFITYFPEPIDIQGVNSCDQLKEVLKSDGTCECADYYYRSFSIDFHDFSYACK